MKRAPRVSGESRALKRKLADTFDKVAPAKGSPDEISELLAILKQECEAPKKSDRTCVRKVAHQLAELCKQGEQGSSRGPGGA